MLIFSGLRWPAARITGRRQIAISLPDSAILEEHSFVTITGGGRGRMWTPEPVDASWRTFAELDLGSDACEDFVKRRGDPYNRIMPLIDIDTSQWFQLANALRVATGSWSEPGEDGVSHPKVDMVARHLGRKVFEQRAAVDALAQVILVPTPQDIRPIGLKATTLAAFLVKRAAQALEDLRPMKRCLQCGFWFEIRREQREPRFCSNSCRAMHHQQPETIDGLDT